MASASPLARCIREVQVTPEIREAEPRLPNTYSVPSAARNVILCLLCAERSEEQQGPLAALVTRSTAPGTANPHLPHPILQVSMPCLGPSRRVKSLCLFKYFLLSSPIFLFFPLFLNRREPGSNSCLSASVRRSRRWHRLGWRRWFLRLGHVFLFLHSSAWQVSYTAFGHGECYFLWPASAGHFS